LTRTTACGMVVNVLNAVKSAMKDVIYTAEGQKE